jgi:hypothetical protein
VSDYEQEVEERPLPDDYALFFDSRFLKAADLRGTDQTVEIERVKFELMPSMKDHDAKELKGSLVLKGKRKLLGLNRTNAECVAQMFGRNPKAWAGHKLTIYPTTVKMKKDNEWVEEPCIRVRGSPELERDLTFTLRLPRKKPIKTTLKKTQDQTAPAKVNATAASGSSAPPATDVSKP